MNSRHQMLPSISTYPGVGRSGACCRDAELRTFPRSSVSTPLVLDVPTSTPRKIFDVMAAASQKSITRATSFSTHRYRNQCGFAELFFSKPAQRQHKELPLGVLLAKPLASFSRMFV